MAYDPAARKQSNSALIIGLVSLVVIGGAALAYFATRSTTDETSPVIMNTRKETITNTIVATPEPGVPTPAPAPNVIVVTPPVNTDTTTTTTTVTPNTRNAEPAPDAPVASPPAEEPKTTVNNTIINPPAPTGNAKPVQPDAAPVAPAADPNAAEGY